MLLILTILQLINLLLILEKFIPFKTPLDDKYKALIPPADLFTPQMLIKSIASYKVINQIQSIKSIFNCQFKITILNYLIWFI